jgi:hypothetical protein
MLNKTARRMENAKIKNDEQSETAKEIKEDHGKLLQK